MTLYLSSAGGSAIKSFASKTGNTLSASAYPNPIGVILTDPTELSGLAAPTISRYSSNLWIICSQYTQYGVRVYYIA